MEEIIIKGAKQNNLKNVNLTIPRNKLTVFTGLSGSGKSSLLRVIAGLVSPKEGDVRFDGQSVLEKKPQERNTAMIFQNLALYPHMTVYQNIAYPLVSRGYSKEIIREKVEETARMLGLFQLLEKRPRRLSGGQRQLVLTPKAELIHKLISKDMKALDERITEGIDKENMEIFYRVLLKIKGNLEESKL